MKLRLNDDHVLIRMEADKAESDSGIIFPEMARELTRHGEVMAVGPGRWSKKLARRLPLDIEQGQRAYFPCNEGHDFLFDGQPHRIIRGAHLMAVE